MPEWVYTAGYKERPGMCAGTDTRPGPQETSWDVGPAVVAGARAQSRLPDMVRKLAGLLGSQPRAGWYNGPAYQLRS
jgi:hypothetical protein